MKLADRIVACGVGSVNRSNKTIPYAWQDKDGLWLAFTTKEFESDWRVAGAMMEKISAGSWEMCDPGWYCEAYREVELQDGTRTTFCRDQSLPRAICEACVEALETNDE